MDILLWIIKKSPDDMRVSIGSLLTFGKQCTRERERKKANHSGEARWLQGKEWRSNSTVVGPKPLSGEMVEGGERGSSKVQVNTDNVLTVPRQRPTDDRTALFDRAERRNRPQKARAKCEFAFSLRCSTSLRHMSLYGRLCDDRVIPLKKW